MLWPYVQYGQTMATISIAVMVACVGSSIISEKFVFQFQPSEVELSVIDRHFSYSTYVCT